MREIPSVSERPVGKIPSTNVTNELARAVQAMSPQFNDGQASPDVINAILDVWIVWDSGPNGEADRTDHTYWLRRAYVSNPTTGTYTDAAQLTEWPNNEPKGADWILATNLSERPENTGGTEADGTHSLTKGKAVGPLWSEFNGGSPFSPARYVFQSGGGDTIGYPQYAGQFLGSPVANQRAWLAPWALETI